MLHLIEPKYIKVLKKIIKFIYALEIHLNKSTDCTTLIAFFYKHTRILNILSYFSFVYLLHYSQILCGKEA